MKGWLTGPNSGGAPIGLWVFEKKLRSKLGDKGEYIKTIWGMGYKFEV